MWSPHVCGGRPPTRRRGTCPRLAVAVAVAAALVGCRGCRAAGQDAGPSGGDGGALVGFDAAPRPGAPRPGMAFIPAGTFRAGTPLDRAPRIATEELPGVPVEMGPFYIDIFPFPNEPGAIPQPNVSRDEAARLCGEKGKRLCTKLEWERACKGPDSATYEYGDTYRSSPCGTGQSAELGFRRPSGERSACRSGFGVRELHGGAWEWTQSTWGRGTHDPSMGVLRGGNAEAGEIVGRCANAIGRLASKRQASFGFRCCAGDPSSAEVTLDVHLAAHTLTLLAKPEERAAPLLPLLDTAEWGSRDLAVDRAWIWQPVGNEDLLVFGGCTPEGPARRCGFVVGRAQPPGSTTLTAADSAPRVLAQLVFPRAMAEMKTTGDPSRIHAKAVDVKGRYVKEISYSYGRVSVSGPQRVAE